MSDKKSFTAQKVINAVCILLGIGLISFILFFGGASMAWYFKFLIEITGWALFIFGFRSIVWQAEKKDWKNLLIILTMCFAILLPYGFNRQVKNVLIKYTIGNSMVPVLKIINGFLCTGYAIYCAKISKKVKLKHVVLYSMVPLLAFFGIFSLFFLKKCAFSQIGSTTNYNLLFHKWLLPNISTNALGGYLPSFIRVLLNSWPAVLYYFVSEMWIVGGLILAFWKPINMLVPKIDKKKFVPIIMVIAQIATLFSGYLNGSFKFADYRITLNWSVGISVLCGIITILCSYKLFQLYPTPDKKKKKKIAVSESLGGLIKKKPEYLYITCLNMFFGAITVLFEAFHRDQANKLFLTPALFKAFTSITMAIQSRIALFLSLFFANLAPKYFSWFTRTIPAPLVVIFGGGTLFVVYILMTLLGISGANSFAVYFGIVVIGLYKSLKYCSIDPSKELLISSYSKEEQAEAKYVESAISRNGKSIPSALIYAVNGRNPWGMGMIFATAIIAPTLGSVWIYITKKLSVALKRNQKKNAEEEKSTAEDNKQNNL